MKRDREQDRNSVEPIDRTSNKPWRDARYENVELTGTDGKRYIVATEEIVWEAFAQAKIPESHRVGVIDAIPLIVPSLI